MGRFALRALGSRLEEAITSSPSWQGPSSRPSWQPFLLILSLVTAVRKSVTPAIHYSALVRLRDIVRESFVAEIHPDYKKIEGKRSASNPVNGRVDIAVLYGCVALGGIDYRAKTTVKIFTASPAASKAYSYEIRNIEILRGYVGTEVQPRDKISIATCILLNGVCDVNGAPLLGKVRKVSTGVRG